MFVSYVSAGYSNSGYSYAAPQSPLMYSGIDISNENKAVKFSESLRPKRKVSRYAVYCVVII